MTGFDLKKVSAALVVAFGVSACATVETPPASEDPFAAVDPYEPTNRTFHEFNVAADRSVLRPVANAYGEYTPAALRYMIGNQINHLDLPNDFANHLLQGEVTLSLQDLARFVVNTVIGAGFLDPASELGLPKESTDFGVTLGKWGVGEGPYLELPLFGPTNPRDFTGSLVDRLFSPFTYISIFIDSNAVTGASIGVSVIGIIDSRHRNGDLIDELFYERADSYVSLRSVYLQRRRSLIAGEEELPDIFEEDEFIE